MEKECYVVPSTATKSVKIQRALTLVLEYWTTDEVKKTAKLNCSSTGEYLQGCMRIATIEIKPDIETLVNSCAKYPTSCWFC
jgi:hypothetical protein